LCVPREENKSLDVYVDDLKQLGRSEDNLDSEIKIVNSISRDMNMCFGLEICPRICLKKGRVQSKMYIGSHSRTVPEQSI
jgi:hypothetical protein